jgi:hypothetical protein
MYLQELYNKKKTEDISPDNPSSTSPISGKEIETTEDAAGVGVVAKNRKMAKDPRYSMSITKDVKPSTPKNMLRALRLAENNKEENLEEKWSQEQRSSVDCNNPKGFSQKAHCAGRKARQAGKKTKSKPISENLEQKDFKDFIKKFMPIARKELELDQIPKIVIQPHVETHKGQATFGRFVNQEKTIYLGIADRHPLDVLRTLAHELVHWKQFLDGRIEPDSGKTGSPIENEAHAIAGIIMRHFNKEYPDAINLTSIQLQENKNFVKQNVQYHDELNPFVWTIDNEMIPEVRQRLLEIAKTFVKYLDIPNFDTKDIVLTGSMANYNWTTFSDFDLHIITDYADLECDNLSEPFYRAKKEIWNDRHNIKIHGYDVELYVEDIDEPPVSTGVFSVLNNQWIKKPKFVKPEISDSAINSKVSDLIDQIKNALRSPNRIEEIQNIKDKLRKMRRAGLDTAGEFSVENLSYKILRNMGLLDKLNQIQTKQQDKALSIVESRDVPEYVYHASYLPDLSNGIKSLYKKGLLPSSSGYMGQGVYFAYSPDETYYHVSKDDATILRVRWKDLVDLYGLYPKNPNGIQRDDEQIIIPGKVPANLIEIEYFPGEFWSLSDALSDVRSHIQEDLHPNAKPRGPEFKPTMPKGTVRVDVSDVYDWYKLGQHISDMQDLGKHDFGKGPPSTILSFGDEDLEHEYIKDLERTGLTTTDIDPASHKKGPKQKVDPTFNVNETDIDQPIPENFADGRNPGRKGLSKRVGIPKKATLDQLEKIAKSSTGERRRMAQWQLNMRRGKAKKNDQ